MPLQRHQPISLERVHNSIESTKDRFFFLKNKLRHHNHKAFIIGSPKNVLFFGRKSNNVLVNLAYNPKSLRMDPIFEGIFEFLLLSNILAIHIFGLYFIQERLESSEHLQRLGVDDFATLIKQIFSIS